MASVSNALPNIFRWIFTVLAGLAALGAVAVCIVMLIDPKLPAGAHFGPITLDLMGQPGTAELSPAGNDSDFTVTALRGNVVLSAQRAGGLLDLLKHYGLPLLFLNMLFFLALFDLMRRLFRNVGRGDSFTPQSVRLVQLLGGSLIVFSIVSAFAEYWFSQAAFTYFAQHTVIMVSGTSLHLPVPRDRFIPHVGGFPFGSPLFFSGLLVLALSEVFRQGLALKSEHDLTV
ncbi:MAG: DUF2975 domain-containing protein [Rhizomicrobium sp.]|jgi:hypothetical protein